MDLKMYLEAKGMSHFVFAKMAKLSPHQLKGFIKKRSCPSKKAARKIVRASRGEIMPYELKN